MEGEEDVPSISLHAISGLQGPRTMRVKGWIGPSKVVLLVDSGSTHNFISPTVASRAGFIPTKERNLDVMVANREKMTSGGVCRGVFIHLGKVLFQVDFYILPIEGCEAVLGAIWLKSLGPILWDFSRLWMSFIWKGVIVELKGEYAPCDKYIKGPKAIKALCGGLWGMFLQI